MTGLMIKSDVDQGGPGNSSVGSVSGSRISAGEASTYLVELWTNQVQDHSFVSA